MLDKFVFEMHFFFCTINSACWVLFHDSLSSAEIFQFFILFFSKNSFRNTIVVSKCMDPDQAQHCVWPELGPNCL